MRHNKKFNHLGRQAGHRKAMLANMATSLIMHKRIETTQAKAKALRMYIEPIITKSKDDSTHARRLAFKALRNKYAVTELFREVAPLIANRPGGYTRILKIGFRQGDAADMCIIELVDFSEYTQSKTATVDAKPKTRRSKKKGDEAATPVKEVAEKAPAKEATPEAVVETPVAPEAPEAEAVVETEEKKAE